MQFSKYFLSVWKWWGPRYIPSDHTTRVRFLKADAPQVKTLIYHTLEHALNQNQPLNRTNADAII
jgi:hypothetical protein